MTPDDTVTRPKRAGNKGKVLRWSLFALLLLVVALLSMFAGGYLGIVRGLPTLDLDAALAVSQSTKIYDSSRPPLLLAELHGLENRDVLSGEQIPQVLRDAVVAIEDERFYSDEGVDFLTVVRAAWADLRNKRVAQGGSPITRQLIKNAFASISSTFDRDLTQTALAYQLENTWSKDKILNEYLNVSYFGEGAYGVQAAARAYFGVDAADLTVAEAALLAGLLDAPSAYSPRRDPHGALERRDLVLNKMYQQRYITSAQLQEGLAEPLELADPAAGEEAAYPYWIELVREQLVARYGSSLVLRGGLRVQTSIDMSLQQAAEEAVSSWSDQPGDPAAALVAVDVHSGQMVAMVTEAGSSGARVNLATQGKRPPGSAFEPFVLVTALENGVSPDTLLDAAPLTGDMPPGSGEISSSGQARLSLAEATATSATAVFTRLAMQLGTASVAQTAQAMGISSALSEEALPAAAMAAPPTGVSPAEMALAFATLASGGERLSAQVTFDPSKAGLPLSIVKVTDPDGRVLDQNDVVHTRVLDAGIAALATRCLRAVVESGMGKAANIGRPAAGVAGTSEDGRDVWFIGYTPELVTAVWVGYPEERPHPADARRADPGDDSLPARIWAAFMAKALAGIPVSEFSDAGVNRWVTLEVCSESHLLPARYCPSLVKMLFRSDKIPVDVCALHAPQEVAVPAVTGMPATKAALLLSDTRFDVSQVYDRDSLRPAGVVVEQRPKAGALLLEGSTVVIVVSTGEGRAVVPSVVGLPLEDAQAKLAAAGLTAEIVYQTDEAPAGTVLAQDPAGAKIAARGSSVRLTVSSGPPETPPST
jgi:penicillin-binding protein 1A